MTQKYYKNELSIRATGDNRYMGGSCNWLKIRRIEIEDNGKEYALYVKIRGFEKAVGIRIEWIKSGIHPENLKFRVQGMPCSIYAVLMHYYGWKDYDNIHTSITHLFLGGTET